MTMVKQNFSLQIQVAKLSQSWTVLMNALDCATEHSWRAKYQKKLHLSARMVTD